MIVDVISRHEGPRKIERNPLIPDSPRSPTKRPYRQPFASGGGSLSGYARQPPTPAILLTLIDALFSP